MKTKLKTMFVAGWLAVLVCPGWAAVAQGAEKTWNAEVGDYFTPAAWQPAGVPGADDDVIIAKGTVILPESATVRSLTLSGTLFLSDADILKTIDAETPPPQPPKEKEPHDTK